MLSQIISSLFFNDTATTEIYTLSLHDALPISAFRRLRSRCINGSPGCHSLDTLAPPPGTRSLSGMMALMTRPASPLDRKSTRLNSSHANISYAVFCLKKNIQQYYHHFHFNYII